MSGFRYTYNQDNRTPIQQATTLEDKHHIYRNNFNRMMLGVVLNVVPSDQGQYNRSAYFKKDARGSMATAKVLAVDDNQSAYTIFSNVIIPPPVPSGLNNYCEYLPKPSFATSTGQTFEASLASIDPYTLEGDWCIIGFLGGTVERPFIVSWWPHSANVFDPATSGKGNVDSNGNAKALDQVSPSPSRVHFGRHFQRINGVEYVINRRGDIYLSTYFSNSKLQHGDAKPTSGRYPRQLNEDLGGSIKVGIKPTQTFELSWNPYVDGLGVRDEVDDDLPQTNPRPRQPDEQAKTNTYVRGSNTSLLIEVPDTIEITTSSFEVESESVVIDSPDVLLGGSEGGNALIDERWEQTWNNAGLLEVLDKAVAASGTAATNKLAIEAIAAYLDAIRLALSSSKTENTKAL